MYLSLKNKLSEKGHLKRHWRAVADLAATECFHSVKN